MKGKTMTGPQMNWNLKKGFAWLEHEDADWWLPIWTKQGGWIWDPNTQLYHLEIV